MLHHTLYLSFFYTHTFFVQKILHSKVQSYTLSVKLHRVQEFFHVHYEKFPSIEIFYTHVVADKYEVCSQAGLASSEET